MCDVRILVERDAPDLAPFCTLRIESRLTTGFSEVKYVFISGVKADRIDVMRASPVPNDRLN